jgi:hypothetical protein
MSEEKEKLIKEWHSIPLYDCAFCGFIDNLISDLIKEGKYEEAKKEIEYYKKHIKERHINNSLALGLPGS